MTPPTGNELRKLCNSLHVHVVFKRKLTFTRRETCNKLLQIFRGVTGCCVEQSYCEISLQQKPIDVEPLIYILSEVSQILSSFFLAQHKNITCGRNVVKLFGSDEKWTRIRFVVRRINHLLLYINIGRNMKVYQAIDSRSMEYVNERSSLLNSDRRSVASLPSLIPQGSAHSYGSFSACQQVIQSIWNRSKQVLTKRRRCNLFFFLLK